jgi:hypothetical protein
LRNLRRVFYMAATIMMLAVAVVSASPAAAGRNGQMVRIIVSCQYAPTIAEVEVTGRNQYGNRVTWRSRPNSKDFVTQGWWWIGPVIIKYKYNYAPNQYGNLPWYGYSVNVPKVHTRNYWVAIVDTRMNCDR